MSVFWRVVLSFVLVVVLNGALLVFMLYTAGTFESMREQSLGILAEGTRNKYQSLQSKMVGWSNLDTLESELGAAIADELAAAGGSYEDIADNPALNAKLVSACADSLITHLRIYDVSGAFVVLNGVGVPGDPQSYAGLYLRDSEPTDQNATNSDLRMLRGLPPLARSTGITLDSFWQASFHFAKDGSGDFFFKPMEAYEKSKRGAAKYYNYWSGRFCMSPQDNVPMFTCSRPLVNAEGEAYGVVGVELDAAYVADIINNGQYDERSNQTFYYLGVTEDGGQSYRCILSSGVGFSQNFRETENLSAQNGLKKEKNGFVTLVSRKAGTALTGFVTPLTLYSPNTAFVGEQWALIGIQAQSTLFALERRFEGVILLVTGLCLLLGVAIAFLAARGVSRPISALVAQLRGTKHGLPRPLEHTGMAEVDVLADTITELNLRLVEDASKISKIITLSGLPVGAFEKREGQNEVFCSEGFFSLMECPELYHPGNRVPVEAFDRVMAERLGSQPDEDEDVYLLKGVEGMRYVRLKQLRDRGGVIGTLMDVTEEMENRRRIEHDRDYDILTNLFNRRAFEHRTQELFTREKERLAPVSALVMTDLDNLKAINDAYGHDSGDVYIRSFAQGLQCMDNGQCLMARRSGDEFFLLYYGFESKEEIRQLIRKGWRTLTAQTCEMPDGTRHRLRASAGIAWYPDDATEYARLLHFADYAMYRAKNAAKGSLEEFSSLDYKETGYLFNGSQALDRLIDSRLVRYMLQPIVSAKDGSVHGYEMLMRPMVAELPTPGEVLSLAKEQGKLYQIEKLTWEMTLSTAAELRRVGSLRTEHKLFINSIASQCMTEEDERLLYERFGDMYPDLVMEITEGEQKSDRSMNRKLEVIQRCGGAVAIDDFGTGYNSDASLIFIDAAYVKLDISFVRDADKDADKRALISNVTRYAVSRGIRVIAEGVETREEMETLTALGADYFQGYYVARPAFAPPVPAEETVRQIRQAAEKRKADEDRLE